MIECSAVDVDRGGASILADVSLSVADGEFLALVGPNGAGKTTLLRTLNGVLTPDAGRVTVDGVDVGAASARELARLVATVPQKTTLSFDFDVRDVVAMGRTPHRSRLATARPADREAIERALARTDTARFADRPVGDLSGGERQRVLLARALAQETPVLLLDEPTASLDINHQVRTLSLVRDLADAGRTVVASVHDLELAARFCDAVALLSEGRLLATGEPGEVFAAERLERAFDVRTAVTTNPVTGSPAVTPLSDGPLDVPPDEPPEGSPDGPSVHVVGGGARAARVVGRLADAGISVSAGVLPRGDAAAETARALGATAVTAAPFGPVADETRAAADRLCERAAVTVLAGPVEEPNRSLAVDSGALLALEGVDAPPSADADVVAERDVVAAVRDRAGLQPATQT